MRSKEREMENLGGKWRKGAVLSLSRGEERKMKKEKEKE